MANKENEVLYTGMTNDLVRRVHEHRKGLVEGFTKRYSCHKLVYYEVFQDAYNAIAREKQIKSGRRQRKIELIEKTNRYWRDLGEQIGIV
jgi:putative endonuclease